MGASLIEPREKSTTVPPLLKIYTSSNGSERCQCCGILILDSFLNYCPQCSVMSYCSTMCLVQHKSELHEHECETFRKLAIEDGDSCVLRVYMIARILCLSKKIPELKSWLELLSFGDTYPTLPLEYVTTLNAMFDTNLIAKASKVFCTYSSVLYDNNLNPIGISIEPLFAPMEPLFQPTCLTLSLSGTKLEFISDRGELTMSHLFSVDKNSPNYNADLSNNLPKHITLRTKGQQKIYQNLICLWCKSPISGIQLSKIFAVARERTGSGRCRIPGYCRVCSRSIPPRLFKEAILTYRELSSRFGKFHTRKNPLPMASADKSRAGRSRKIMRNMSAMDTLALLLRANLNRLLQPYCYPLGELWSLVIDSFEIKMTFASSRDLLFYRLFVLFHVDLAKEVPPSILSITKALSQAVCFMSTLLKIAEKEANESLRISSIKAMAFFRFQSQMLQLCHRHSSEEANQFVKSINLQPNVCDESLWRSAQRILSASNVQLESHANGQSFRFANGQTVLLFLSLLKCAQLFSSSKLLKHHSKRHIQRPCDDHYNVSRFHCWKDPKDERSGQSTLSPSKRYLH